MIKNLTEEVLFLPIIPKRQQIKIKRYRFSAQNRQIELGQDSNIWADCIIAQERKLMVWFHLFVLFLLGPLGNLLEQAFQLAHILETPVNTGETNVGDFIQLGQFIHD